VLAVLILAGAGCSGCDERADASPGDAAPPPPAPAPLASAAPAASSSASIEKGELRVLKAVFTSEVKNKEPAGALESAKPGQRVWAHLTVRNRGDAARTLTLVFKVGGAERSTVDLAIDPSWSFRTWGYVTLRKTDVGEVRFEVKDEGGVILSSGTLPIKAGEGAP
jgi:hypothetical protein